MDLEIQVFVTAKRIGECIRICLARRGDNNRSRYPLQNPRAHTYLKPFLLPPYIPCTSVLGEGEASRKLIPIQTWSILYGKGCHYWQVAHPILWYHCSGLDPIRRGYRHKKPPDAPQDVRLAPAAPGSAAQNSSQLLAVLDGVNGRWGRGTLRYLAEGGAGGQTWRMRRERLSPADTTRWTELPGVG